jgi:hypothetical protein
MGFHFVRFAPGRIPLSEVASRLQIPESVLRSEWKKNALEGVAEGGTIWFEGEAVERWLQKREVRAVPPAQP